MSSLGLLLLSVEDHVNGAAQLDPAGIHCCPLGRGPYAPPNLVLSAMLPGSIRGLLGEMARKLDKSQPRVKVCEGIVLLPGGNSKSRISFHAAAQRDVCISPRITRKSWSKIGDAGNCTRNHEINQFGA